MLDISEKCLILSLSFLFWVWKKTRYKVFTHWAIPNIVESACLFWNLSEVIFRIQQHLIQRWFATAIVLMFTLILFQLCQPTRLMMHWHFSLLCTHCSSYHSIRKVEQSGYSTPFYIRTNVTYQTLFATLSHKETLTFIVKENTSYSRLFPIVNPTIRQLILKRNHNLIRPRSINLFMKIFRLSSVKHHKPIPWIILMIQMQRWRRI